MVATFCVGQDNDLDSAYTPVKDTSSVFFLSNGSFSGQFRTYMMNTVNQGELQDWYSWALGGNLGYQTTRWKGFRLATRFYATVEILGNSGELDSLTGRQSRYEIVLYDITDREIEEVALLGTAYIDFKWRKHQFWLGRHLLNTPLFNPQDGRMIPTLAQGFWYTNTSFKDLKLEAGYISHVAPRGSRGWFRLRNSIGVYSTGRNPDDSPSGYAGNLESNGLFIVAMSLAKKRFDFKVHNFYVENIFNATYAEAFYKGKLFGLDGRIGGQYIFEHQVGNGGNEDFNKRYFQDKLSHVFGGRMELRMNKLWTFTCNYNRITAHGRFLFPREWGREFLFVFQKRERSEGQGDMNAFMVDLRRKWELGGDKLDVKASYGHYYLTDPTQASLNKTSLPSYFQLGLNAYYQFGGVLKGLVAEYYITYKGSLGGDHDNPDFTLNKVKMFHWDLVMNYSF